MASEYKLKNLYQFLTTKNSGSSKVSLNVRSETTSPSSNNERNNSTQTKSFHNEANHQNNQIKNNFCHKKTNTIDKNCYNNINLLANLKGKEDEDDINDSTSNDLNQSKINNISKISIMTIPKNKIRATYDKSSFSQIMKYFTSRSRNKIKKMRK